MASFKAKIGQKRLSKRENKNYRFVSFRPYPTRNRKFQKNSKKIQKIKNTIMASFQTKIGLKILRQEENKNSRSVSSLPNAQYKIPKKIAKKLKNTIMASL